MRMHVTQKGITMIGFAIVLCVVGFFAYAAMKLIPVYSEYFGIAKAMKQLQTEPNIETKGIDEIRALLNVKFSVQYVDDNTIPKGGYQLITENGQRSLRIAYDKDIPFIYNVDLLIHFSKTVDLAHGGSY
jgi:hypothetical protein